MPSDEHIADADFVPASRVHCKQLTDCRWSRLQTSRLFHRPELVFSMLNDPKSIYFFMLRIYPFG